MDRIVRAMARDGSAHACVLESAGMVNAASIAHGLSPMSAAVLGRALGAASLMGCLLKDKGNSLTLRVEGVGPAGKALVVSDWMGNVRGYIGNRELPVIAEDGALDVASAFGPGTLTVIKDIGLGEPFSGRVNLVDGGIARDIAEYYMRSEQVPSVCALGEYMAADGSCVSAGGLLACLLPFSDPETAAKLERNAASLPPVSSVLRSGGCEDLLDLIFRDIPYDLFDEMHPEFKCTCSRARTRRALAALGRDELADMIAGDGGARLKCEFCNKEYIFTGIELAKIMESII